MELIRRTPRPRLVVVSAREGVTDLLRSTLETTHDRALQGRVLSQLERLHPEPRPAVRRILGRLAREFRGFSRATSTPPRTDAILAVGERLAAHWMADRLNREGVPAGAVEADSAGLLTDGRFGEATIRLEASRARVRGILGPLLGSGQTPVVTGFLGRGPGGCVTTLGRGGSDYTATSLGYLLDARRVILVKENVSLLSADPRLVPGAIPLPRLSYEEAEELAQFGARVLHPLTVEPARRKGIELCVQSLHRRESSTLIGPGVRGGLVRALTLLSPVALLVLRVPGGRQRRGVIARVGNLLRDRGINVVTMFTSSALLLVFVEGALASRARTSLEPLAQEDGASLEGPRRISLVTAIGERILRDLPEIPTSLVTQALGMSATPRTISLAVPEEGGVGALRLLHRLLVERSRKGTPRRRVP